MLEVFGQDSSGETVHSIRLKNSNGLIVDLINYGATIQKILVPNESKGHVDVCLGYSDMKGYLSPSNPYMGATIGRVCNRICDGQFSLGGRLYSLHQNDQLNSLHGGRKGFDKKIWRILNHCEESASFQHESPSGDEGYPSSVSVRADFHLSESNELQIIYSAKSDGDTPLNLTNHVYFNLGGEAGGSKELMEHEISIHADKYTPMREDTKIPTGDIMSVVGSPFDLRKKSRLGNVIHEQANLFDHNYVLDSNEMKLAAEVVHPSSGRGLECWTNQWGLQFYTGNHLGNDSKLCGKSGTAYARHGGFCLEAQNYPDAINQRNFPNCILKARECYENKITYKFIF